MNWRKTSFLTAAIAALCLSPGCNLLGLYATKIVGVYEAVDSTDGPSGGRVEVYSLNDDGTQTPVSGELGTGKTGRQGYFVLYLFQKIQNLIIEITQNGETTKSTLTDVQQGAQSASSLPAASLKIAPALVGDNNTIYITVNTESAMATDLLLEEVRQEHIPPDQVSLYDIDEMLDAGIAAKARENTDLYDCIIRHIGMARRLSRNLFITILEDANLNFDNTVPVPNSVSIIKAALTQIEAVRKEYGKILFMARKSNADSDLIDTLLEEQRRKVLDILAAAGIPPQLYMKARLIAEAEFERALNTAAADCEFPPTLRYRLIQRALIRKAQENALQTESTLLHVFGYDGSTNIDAALAAFLGDIKKLNAGEDNRLALRDAMLRFHGQLIDELRSAAPDRSAAILNITSAIQGERLGLEVNLLKAQSSADVQIAFETFYDAIRPAVFKNLGISPSDTPEQAAQKKAIADLLFTLGI